MYGSIESANIVGYTNAELQQYGLTAGAAFTPVSGKAFDLNDLSVTGYDKEDGSEGDVYIQTLDEYGRTVATYFWIDVVDGEDVLHGWLDGNDDPVEPGAVTFQAGEGLWVFCQDESFGLQSAGQVPQSDVSVNLQQYGLSVANPTPVTVDLNACTITGYDPEDGSEGDVYVQTLDEYGRTVATYFWIDVVDGEDVLLGWLDGNDEPIDDGTVTIAAGAGIWSFCQDDGFSFVWPKVDIK